MQADMNGVNRQPLRPVAVSFSTLNPDVKPQLHQSEVETFLRAPIQALRPLLNVAVRDLTKSDRHFDAAGRNPRMVPSAKKATMTGATITASSSEIPSDNGTSFYKILTQTRNYAMRSCKPPVNYFDAVSSNAGVPTMEVHRLARLPRRRSLLVRVKLQSGR